MCAENIIIYQYSSFREWAKLLINNILIQGIKSQYLIHVFNPMIKTIIDLSIGLDYNHLMKKFKIKWKIALTFQQTKPCN